jgi:hypothetical protein
MHPGGSAKRLPIGVASPPMHLRAATSHADNVAPPSKEEPHSLIGSGCAGFDRAPSVMRNIPR